jgi:protein-disulfide isomerase
MPRYAKSSITLLLNVLLFAAISRPSGALEAPSKCGVLTEQEKSTLATYVQKKYKIPATAAVNVVSDMLFDNTCYHKLQFHSVGATQPLSVTLYSSPDKRFLLTDVFDLTVDPVEQERKRNRELMASLMQGSFPSLGPPNAPVTIIEFADFQCPFCQHAADILKSFAATENGKNVRIIFRHFPLPFHPWAKMAAEATACVNFQSSDRFWELHDWIFEHQKLISAENVDNKLLDVVRSMQGIDVDTYQKCLGGLQVQEFVRTDTSVGSANAVQGTPTFFINGRRIAGMRSIEDLGAIVSEAQREAEPGLQRQAQK